MLVLAAGSAATEGERSLRVTSTGSAGSPAESAAPAAAERAAAGAARSTGFGTGRGRSGRDGAARAGVTVTAGSDGCGSMSCACAVCPARMASRTKTQETATHLRRHMRAPEPQTQAGSRSYFVGALRAADEGRSRSKCPARFDPPTIRSVSMMSIAKHHTRDTTPWSCGTTATPLRGADLRPVHIVLDRLQRNDRLENKAPRIVINVDAAAQVRSNALD